VQHTQRNPRPSAPAQAVAASAAAAPRTRAHTLGWAGWAAPILIFTLLRVPTLFEPHWYTDEAGYAVTAWLSQHGHTLYGAVWNNKPPLLFWTYGLVLALAGPSEAALHLLSWLSGLAAVVVVFVILRSRQGPVRAAVGAGLAAVVLGTPILNGDLALPENLLIGPSALGVLAILWADEAGERRRWVGRTVCAGALFATAVLYQQTALDVVAAATLWLAVRRGAGAWPRVLVLLGTIAVLVAAALLPYAVRVGPGRLAFLLATSYGGYAASSLPPTFLNVAVRLVEAGALLGGAIVARRIAGWRLLVWIWAAACLIVATLPNRPYPHLGLPAAAPLAVLLASVVRPRRPRWLSPARLGEGLLAVAVLLPVGIGWSLLSPPGAFYSLPLTGVYYQNFIGRLTGAVSPARFRAAFGQENDAEAVAARWLRDQGLAGASAVVWSADAWIDLLAPLRPQLVTPTIYMNEYWLGAAGVLDRVDRGRPRVIVTDRSALRLWPGVRPILARSYRAAFATGSVTVWVRRSG